MSTSEKDIYDIGCSGAGDTIRLLMPTPCTLFYTTVYIHSSVIRSFHAVHSMQSISSLTFYPDTTNATASCPSFCGASRLLYQDHASSSCLLSRW